MSRPRFRFTLNSTSQGTQVISEPGGWDEAALLLDRNKDGHSLVELYDQPLTFWSPDGGYDYIKAFIAAEGADGKCDILIEISDDLITYETVFQGIIDIPTKKEIDFYKAEFGVIRNDFWSKFTNRRKTPVDIQSAVDLDGNAISVIDTVTTMLPSQKIQKEYLGEAENNIPFNMTEYRNNPTIFIQMELDPTLDEIDERHTLSNSGNFEIPANFFTIRENGDYELDLRIEASIVRHLGEVDPGHASPTSCFLGEASVIKAVCGGAMNLVVSVNNVVVGTATESNHGSGDDMSTSFTFNDSFTFQKGDVIRIYFDVSAEFTYEEFLSGPLWEVADDFVIYGKSGVGFPVHVTVETLDPVPPNNFFCEFEDYSSAFSAVATASAPSATATPSYINLVGQTVFTDSETESVLIHDAFQSVLDRIIGQNDSFYSEYFGSQYTNGRVYGADGCEWKNALMKGLHLKGFDFSSKKMFASFDDLFAGANPIFNLGFGYEEDPDSSIQEVIRIERKEHFYDSTSNSITLDYVNNIEADYEDDHFYKKIEIGYAKWEGEEISGIDDPQTKHTYASRFERIGKDIDLQSKYIAASLAIESTRRRSVEKTKDWKLDNDTFIIALNDTPVATDIYTPELDENYSAITDLLNSETRYNIGLTPMRNMFRWLDFFNCGLQDYLSSVYRFTSGEGNYDMASNHIGSGCNYESANFAENQNIPVTSDRLFTPEVYNFTHKLTWQEYSTIRENRKKSIGVSRTNTGHIAFFILTLEYQPTHGSAKFKVIKA